MCIERYYMEESSGYYASCYARIRRRLTGVVFSYPSDKKSKSGKLRLLYEGYPMAYLTEQVPQP